MSEPKDSASRAMYPKRASERATFKPSIASQDLSEFEYGLMTQIFGFQRSVQNCMGAQTCMAWNALDILVMHAVNHRARGKRLAEICMVLIIDDAHLVTRCFSFYSAVCRRGPGRQVRTTCRCVIIRGEGLVTGRKR
jgi:predicted MarR family transcription regulator